MLDFAALKQQVNLLDLIAKDTSLEGGPVEFFGACPHCGGTDRFHVNKNLGWFCRNCQGDPSTDHWHDAIDYIQWRDDVGIVEAYRRLGGDTSLTPAESARLLLERTEREQEKREEQKRLQQLRRDELNRGEFWKEYYLNLDQQNKRQLWHERGLSDLWIDYFKVGYSGSRMFAHDGQYYTYPSLTIPTFQAALGPENTEGREVIYTCVGLAHRLLSDNPPGGKYRPHLPGTGKPLFCADYMPPHHDILIVEGEIKAMVTWANIQEYAWNQSSFLGRIQVIGIAGQGFKQEWVYELEQAEQIWICLDPDATASAEKIAYRIGSERSRIIELPRKIDDMLNDGELNASDIESLLFTARKIR